MIEVDRKWYAIYTKSHFEKKVEYVLRKKRIRTFLPLIKENMNIAGTYRLAEAPLFRSYLFVNISLGSNERYGVLDTTGISCIVKRGGEACPVPPDVIESLRRLVEKRNGEVRVLPGMSRGERVRIVKGPLRGIVGEILEIDGKGFKFIVNLDILGRAIEVTMEPDYVCRI